MNNDFKFRKKQEKKQLHRYIKDVRSTAVFKLIQMFIQLPKYNVYYLIIGKHFVRIIVLRCNKHG